jgi:hypothetical protein
VGGAVTHEFIVHNNGTSKQEFWDQFIGVYNAADDLIRKLTYATPNMRDYYPAEDGMRRFKEARAAIERMVREAEAMKQWATEGYLRAEGGNNG